MAPTRTHRPIDIGEIITHGVVFDFKNWQGGAVDAAHLPQTVTRLFALLHDRKIGYVLVGGIAVLHYVEGRNTQDIDLIVDAEALSQLPEIEVSNRDENFARGHFSGLRVDLCLAGNPVFAAVRRDYSQRIRSGQQEICVATVEGLLLTKLYALPSLYRQQDFTRVGLYENDVAALLHKYKTPVDRLLAVLEPHLLETDVSELRRIVADIQQRIERFERGSRDK